MALFSGASDGKMHFFLKFTPYMFLLSVGIDGGIFDQVLGVIHPKARLFGLYKYGISRDNAFR